MSGVVYAASLYAFLLVALRIAGKRTMAQLTPFDVVLLLVIAEATQQAFLGEDFSLMRAFVVVSTLVVLDIGLNRLKQRSARITDIVEGTPVVVVEHGCLLPGPAGREGVDEGDVLEAARLHHGLERLDQVKYAVLERTGGISVIPYRPEAGGVEGAAGG